MPDVEARPVLALAGESDLVGRIAELDRVAAAAGALDTLPRGILLHGREGIGKSALWRAGVALCQEAGYRVLHSALSRNESRLAFAGLADLIRPVLSEVLPRLPLPQAGALESALAISSAGSVPDERAVAFGLHGALSILARESPVALAVDDIQWLDPSSALMLSYAIRRLQGEPILVVLAQRDGDFAEGSAILAGVGFEVETIEVGPLPLGAVHRLIRVRLGFSLARPDLLKVFAQSQGNPLHALELARSLAAHVAGAPDALPALLAQRVAALPEPTREALALVALASDTDTQALQSAYGPTLSVDLAPAVTAELVAFSGNRARFTHPLVAQAAETAVSAVRRQQLHRLLADAAASDEAKATHLAQATDAPDAEIAEVIEQAARSTRLRGARAATASMYEAAARLTPPDEPRQRAARWLAAAQAWYEAGDARRAEDLLRPLVAELAGGDGRAEAAWRLGLLLDDAGRWQEATALWREALGEVVDGGLRAELLASLAITTLYTVSVVLANEHARAAVAAAETSPKPVHLARALAVEALTLAINGDVGFRRVIERALALEAAIDEPMGDWSPSAVAAECARLVGDVEASRTYYTVVLERAARVGDANVEQWATYGIALAEIATGGYARASELADIVLDLADQTGQMRIPARSLRAHVDGYLGSLADARRLAGEAIQAAQVANEATHQFVALTVLGAIETCASDASAAAAAFAGARAIAADIGLAHAAALRGFLNEAETAAAAGNLDQADAALELFRATIRNELPLWSIPILHRAQGAVLAARGDLAGARRELGAAIEVGAMAAPDHARTLLALGTVDRRLREHVRARQVLGEALKMFKELGSPPWIVQTEAQLGRIPGRRSRESGILTDAEARIADLVASGRSNRDVAAALVLSVKTVEVTLTRVYQKLGVRTRAELAHQYGARAKE